MALLRRFAIGHTHHAERAGQTFHGAAEDPEVWLERIDAAPMRVAGRSEDEMVSWLRTM